MHFTYVFTLAFTLFYPLYKSFESRVQFHKQWRFLFPAIFISAIIFIAWDIWFTEISIWSFNRDYLLGWFIAGLPIEEWLFFFITPFSCVFIYEVLNYFVKKDIIAPYAKGISITLISTLLISGFMNTSRTYTSIVFITLALVLLLLQFILKSAYLPRFYLTWAVCMIPFLLVNGVLTAMPVIRYNELHILNLRIFTIPIEDVFYGMLNVLMVIAIYEYLKTRKQ
jgi:lycopene cyclase domain-containing protein